MLLTACLHYFGLMRVCFLCLIDVFRHPAQIPARYQEPLLVWGILWEPLFRSIQDKLVRTLLKALSHGLPAAEKHFSGTLDPARRKSLPHALPTVFLYYRSTKVWHDGSVWQTQAAPWRQVHHFQGATLVDPQEVWWVRKAGHCSLGRINTNICYVKFKSELTRETKYKPNQIKQKDTPFSSHLHL